MKIYRRAAAAERGKLFEHRLAAYLSAAGVAGTAVASDAPAAIVSNTTVQPFGIDGAVPIDFNSDGQVDFEIDHDNIDLGGGNVVDYLQIDKNDTNGASPGEDPLPINELDTFPTNGGLPNDTAIAAYVTPTGAIGEYPAALTAGTPIGPGSPFDFQEGNNFDGNNQRIRANRLIDEDAGRVDMTLGGLSAGQIQVPFNGPNFLGLGGEVGYLGVRMEFQSTDVTNFGWIGIRITDEADATGEVVGWAYETTPNTPIRAGEIPEPASVITALVGGVTLVGCLLWRRVFGRR